MDHDIDQCLIMNVFYTSFDDLCTCEHVEPTVSHYTQLLPKLLLTRRIRCVHGDAGSIVDRISFPHPSSRQFNGS